jgi:hypothetical protein
VRLLFFGQRLTILFHAIEVAEPAERFFARDAGIHAALDEEVDALLEMEAQLVIDVCPGIRAPEAQIPAPARAVRISVLHGA